MKGASLFSSTGLSFLFIWGLIGCAFFFGLVVLLFRTGVVFTARKQDGTLKDEIPLSGILAMLIIPFSLTIFLLLANLISLKRNDLILSLWEACENGAGGVADPYWLDIIDGLLVAQGSSFADSFVEFAIWNLHTSNRADPDSYYESGSGYPLVRRTSVRPPHSESVRSFYGSTQYWSASVDGRAAMTAALVAANPGELPPGEVIVRVPGAVGPAIGERIRAVAARDKLHLFSSDGRKRVEI